MSRKLKCLNQTAATFPKLNVFLALRMEFSFVTVFPKYLNFDAFVKYIFGIFIIIVFPDFCWRKRSFICVYVFASVLALLNGA
jgi:hypothetical protein